MKSCETCNARDAEIARLTRINAEALRAVLLKEKMLAAAERRIVELEKLIAIAAENN